MEMCLEMCIGMRIGTHGGGRYIIEIDDFLSADECELLIDRASPRMQQVTLCISAHAA